MSAILTNTSAMLALQTLRRVNGSLEETQQRVSSGLRVESAADDPAYWSIATTMRSDSKSFAAVSDALGISAAKVDTAYTGMTSALNVMAAFKAKLVSATEAGVDKTKIQAELDQLKQQMVSIANSTSFNGQNWLNTDVNDIYDIDNNSASVVTSFVRGSDGSVRVLFNDTHLSATSLFNSTGGGLLQQDMRDMNTIGGIRYVSNVNIDGTKDWAPENASGGAGKFQFTFSGPMSFALPTDKITFDVTVDKDNPAEGMSPPFNVGRTTPVTIDRSTVDAVDPSWNGVISNFTQYTQVLSHALSQANTGAYAALVYDHHGALVPDAIAIVTAQDRSFGLDGSYVEVSGFTPSGVSGGGLGNNNGQGLRGSQDVLSFVPFQDYLDGDKAGGLRVDFSFTINNAPPKSYSFDRAYVNSVLGITNGKVQTADQMVTLLGSLLSADWPTLKIESLSPSSVTIKSDPLQDRRSGSDTFIGFLNAKVSNEPIPTIDFRSIDIAANPGSVAFYLTFIESAGARMTTGAAQLGSLQKRLDIQSNITHRLLDNIQSGVARLVDADMEKESAKLAAEQTRQQLAVQSLSIANNGPQTILALFK